MLTRGLTTIIVSCLICLASRASVVWSFPALPDNAEASAEFASREVQPKSEETRDRFLKKWLEQDAAYIATEEEKSGYQKLETDDERYQFIEQFWFRRDPDPATPENEVRDEHYRRVAYANERFRSDIPGWKTDRGRIYISWGPPDQIDSYPNGREGVSYPFEIWHYRNSPGVGSANGILLELVGGEYRLVFKDGVLK